MLMLFIAGLALILDSLGMSCRYCPSVSCCRPRGPKGEELRHAASNGRPMGGVGMTPRDGGFGFLGVFFVFVFWLYFVAAGEGGAGGGGGG